MQDIIDEIVRNYFENTLYEIESVPFGLTTFMKAPPFEISQAALNFYEVFFFIYFHPPHI